MSKIISLNTHKKQISEQLALELTATSAHVEQVQSRMQQITALVFDVMLNELKDGKLSAYNASCAYANLVNSACKLERLRLDIIDRLSGVTPKEQMQDEKDIESSELKETKRLAEALLSKMLRNKYGGGTTTDNSTATVALPKSTVTAKWLEDASSATA